MSTTPFRSGNNTRINAYHQNLQRQQHHPEEISLSTPPPLPTPHPTHDNQQQTTSSSTPCQRTPLTPRSKTPSRTPSTATNHNYSKQQDQHHQQQQQSNGAFSSPSSITSPNNNQKQLNHNQISQQLRDPSPERECDEYRISPVIVSVRGPLSLRFPGSDYAEVSVPSLSADVLVIASLADSFANGECSLGIPRGFVRDAHLDRETGVVTFNVTGVRSFGDSTVTLRAQEAALDLATKLLWLVTGQSSHASPAPDLVTRAAKALHAVAALKQESKKSDRVKAAESLNEMRLNRRKLLQNKWDREEESEKESAITRNQKFASPMNNASSGFRSVSEIVNSPVSPNSVNGNGAAANSYGNDARSMYTEQLRSMLLRNLGSSPLH